MRQDWATILLTLAGAVAGGSGGGTARSAKISGSSPAGIHCSLPAARTSFSRISRPSSFQTRSSSRSTGPYSFPCTRTIHSSGMRILTVECRETLAAEKPWSCRALQLRGRREVPFDRRALLRLPILLCDTGPLEFPRRTNQRDPRFRQDGATNVEG